MRLSPRTSFPVLLFALLMPLSLGAQQPAEPLRPAPDAPNQSDPVQSDPDQSDPNWPAGLENWETPARDPEGDPMEAERRGLTSQDVKESLPGDPTEQGTRPPTVLEEEEGADADAEQGESVSLYTTLSRVRSAPPGLDGQPIPRPNPLASEPAKEMAPLQPRDAYLFPEDYVE